MDSGTLLKIIWSGFLIRVQKARIPVVSRPVYRFYSVNFWLNLMHFCPSRSRIPSLEAIKQTKTWIKRLFFQNGLCYSKRTSTFAKFPPLSSLVLQSDRHKTSTSQNMSTEYTRELGDFRRSCTLPWQRWTWNFAARILTPPAPHFNVDG